MRVAFLTTSDLHGVTSDDHLAVAPLSELGHAVDFVEWRRPIDWALFDCVVIRSTWDYQDDPARFIGVLEQIENSSAVLFNSRDLVLWNLDKSYLADLARRGVEVVPSRFGRDLRREALAAAYDALSVDEIVVKPTVGASALDTLRVPRESLAERAAELEGLFANRGFLLQPFLRGVVEDGEHSLFYFNGAFSHAVAKRPAATDFRVQEEFGASIEPLSPAPELRRAAARALAVLDASPLYARVDLVREEGRILLMELELIEPSLYLRTGGAAPGRFAAALHERILEHPAGAS